MIRLKKNTNNNDVVQGSCVCFLCTFFVGAVLVLMGKRCENFTKKMMRNCEGEAEVGKDCGLIFDIKEAGRGAGMVG